MHKIKKNKLKLTKDTALLGFNECLGTVTIQDLAEIICELCGSADSIIRFSYGGLGKCAPTGTIYSYSFIGTDYTTPFLSSITISKTDKGGHDLDTYLVEELTIGSTIKLTDTSNPTISTYFEVDSALDECADSYIVPVKYLSGMDLDEKITYKLDII